MEVHEYVHGVVFADWDAAEGPAPAWFPEEPEKSNIAWLMRTVGAESYRQLHAWSVSAAGGVLGDDGRAAGGAVQPVAGEGVGRVGRPGASAAAGGAKLNVVESCFQAADDLTAVICQVEDGWVERRSVAELRAMTYRVANGLVKLGPFGRATAWPSTCR